MDEIFKNQNIIYLGSYIFLGIFMIYLSEVGGYIWHKWIAHTDGIPGIRESHKIHHVADLSHEAHEDFFWVVLLLISLGISLSYIYLKKCINLLTLFVIYIPVVLSFTWNWYIHSAYHQKDHWLGSYDWFRNDRRIHFQHHVNPRVNYSIATHFMDEIMETFDYGYPVNIDHSI